MIISMKFCNKCQKCLHVYVALSDEIRPYLHCIHSMKANG